MLRCKRIEGYGYAGEVAFVADVLRGTGKQEIQVHVDAETIIALGKHLDQFDLSNGIGHAMYHWDHKDLEVPCSQCVLKAPSHAKARRVAGR